MTRWRVAFLDRRRGWVLAACTAYRFIMGLAFALPVALSAARVTGEHPRSDAVLWDAGGFWLLEAARHLEGGIAADLALGGMALFVLALGWLFWVAVLVAHAADGERSGRMLAARAIDRLAPLSILFGLTLCAQAATVAMVRWLLGHITATDIGVTHVVVAGTGAVLCALFAVGHDAARVVCVERRPDVWDLINHTFELLRARPFATLAAASWRAALGGALLLGGLVWTHTLMPGGEAALAGAWALQIVAIAGFVALRISWFGWLLRQRPASTS